MVRPGPPWGPHKGKQTVFHKPQNNKFSTSQKTSRFPQVPKQTVFHKSQINQLSTSHKTNTFPLRPRGPRPDPRSETKARGPMPGASNPVVLGRPRTSRSGPAGPITKGPSFRRPKYYGLGTYFGSQACKSPGETLGALRGLATCPCPLLLSCSGNLQRE